MSLFLQSALGFAVYLTLAADGHIRTALRAARTT